MPTPFQHTAYSVCQQLHCVLYALLSAVVVWVQVVPRRGTGFFSGLNAKRREGGAESGKQVTMLLHAQRRLEESAHK